MAHTLGGGGGGGGGSRHSSNGGRGSANSKLLDKLESIERKESVVTDFTAAKEAASDSSDFDPDNSVDGSGSDDGDGEMIMPKREPSYSKGGAIGGLHLNQDHAYRASLAADMVRYLYAAVLSA